MKNMEKSNDAKNLNKRESYVSKYLYTYIALIIMFEKLYAMNINSSNI